MDWQTDILGEDFAACPFQTTGPDGVERTATLVRHIPASGAGSAPRRAVLFLHGWPQSGAAFEPLMTALCAQARVVAMDLPGIGGSSPAAPGGEKRAIAACVQGVIR